jgi:hypothetical protein
MIYTSYFARANKLTDVYRISISVSTPQWAIIEDRMPLLAPSWDILNRYKKDGDVRKYRRDYFELLRERRDAVPVMLNRLEELGKNHTVLLCCWESADKFCHRRLLVEFAGKDWPEYIEGDSLF